jgi:hypothetical protein
MCFARLHVEKRSFTGVAVMDMKQLSEVFLGQEELSDITLSLWISTYFEHLTVGC